MIVATAAPAAAPIPAPTSAPFPVPVVSPPMIAPATLPTTAPATRWLCGPETPNRDEQPESVSPATRMTAIRFMRPPPNRGANLTRGGVASCVGNITRALDAPDGVPARYRD